MQLSLSRIEFLPRIHGILQSKLCFLFLCSVFAAFFASLSVNLLLGFFSLMLAGLAIAFIARLVPEISRILWWAFAIRVFACLVQTFVMKLPSSTGDAIAFEEIGYRWSQEGFLGTFEYFNIARSFIYSWFIAAAYSLTDRSILMIQTVNVLLGSLVVIQCYRAGVRIWGAEVARALAWMICLLPPMILFSAITMRDMPMIFFLSLGMRYAVDWFYGDRLIDFGRGCLGFFLAGILHGALLLIIPLFAIFFIGRSLIRAAKGRVSSLILLIVALLTMINLGGWAIASKVGGSKLSYLYEEKGFEAAMTRMQGVSPAKANQAMHAGLQITSVSDLIRLSPRFIAYFLYTPFPWMMSRIYDLERLAMALMWAIISLIVIFNFLDILKRPGAPFILVVVGFIIVAYAFGSRDVNTAYRHKTKALPLVLLLCAPYLSKGLRRLRFSLPLQ